MAKNRRSVTAESKSSHPADLVPIQRIERSILVIRGHRVILDTDLAELYGIPIKRLNEQVKRNVDRFPADFMFRMTWAEAQALRS